MEGIALENILYGMITICSAGLGYLFFIEMFPERRWKSDWSEVFFWITVCATIGIQTWQGQYEYISNLGMLFFPVLHGIVLSSFYKCNFQAAFVWMWFYSVTYETLKMPVQTVEKLLLKQNVRLERRSFSEVLWCFFIILFFSYIHKVWSRKIIADFRNILEKKREILFGFAVLAWSMLTVMLYAEQWAVSAGNLILDLIVFGTLGVLFWQIYTYVNRLRRMEQELIRQQNVWLREQKAIKDGYVKDAKRLHDMKHVLLYLQKCITEKDTESAEEYLKKYTEEMSKTPRRIWTGYSEIDFSVNYYYQMMQEKGIQFTMETDIHSIPMEDQDMMIVLGNLLDNAMTAAEKCEPGEKHVHLKVQTINEMFLMRIENSTIQMPEKKNGRFLSSKTASEYHGWGIENVKQIVKKYDGDIRFEYTNTEFQVEMILYESIARE